MYIIKNALKCIGRAKGRNILIGLIALVIAVASCIGLSIRQAAKSAQTSTLEGMRVTATISFDRQAMMNSMGRPGQSGESGGFNREQFAERMTQTSELTLEEYQTYAEAEAVQDFYYTLTAYFDGSDALEPVTADSEQTGTLDGSLDSGMGGMGGFSGGRGMMGNMASGDFTLIGYSSDSAMTAFGSGAATITDGAVFEEGTTDSSCIISEELAAYNDLAVGDTIRITNPNLETETYELTVVGIYSSEGNNDFSMSRFGASQDPANRIYMSAAALQRILDASEEASVTQTDTNTGRTYETAVTGNLSATYVFADADSYYAFEDQARALGLDEAYTVSSSDVTAFENSLTPLNTLSTMAGWFLLVILIIGGVILMVLNIFNVRERKYEIGVLTAMGMKKWKVATQFLCEILVVTMISVLVGAGIGAVSAVPVTNALLANQVESQQTQQTQVEENFGRQNNMGGWGMNGNRNGNMDGWDMNSNRNGNMDGRRPFDTMMDNATNYVTQIDSAMNLTVVWQMIGIGLLLTLVASAVSVLFVMRYDPLKILANRD